MNIRLFFTVLCFLSLMLSTAESVAQEMEGISLSSEQYCTYAGANEDFSDLSFFPNDSSFVVRKVAELLQKTKNKQNFYLLASDVNSAAAVLADSTRYLFYSRSYFIQLRDTVLITAILAHEVGHHVKKHRFPKSPVLREIEETDADEFAGYALFWVGVSRSTVEAVAGALPLPALTTLPERKAALLRGWDLGLAQLSCKPSAPFKSNDDKVKGFPEMLLPPPAASASQSIEPFFVNCRTMGEANYKICQSLNACGYVEWRYFSVKGGFAVVTRLEQTNPEGWSLNNDDRWAAKPVRESSFSMLNYLKRIVYPSTGYFRAFVFIVTAEPLFEDQGRRMNPDWPGNGATQLPQEMADRKLGKGTNIHSLIYEFQMKASTLEPEQTLKNKRLSGETHLKRSNLWNALTQAHCH